MPTFTSDQRRRLQDRLHVAGRTTGVFGISRAAEAPFAAAVLLFGLLLVAMAVVTWIGSILAGILPQVGAGLAIGLLIGFGAMRRREKPASSASTAIVLGTTLGDVTRR